MRLLRRFWVELTLLVFIALEVTVIVGAFVVTGADEAEPEVAATPTRDFVDRPQDGGRGAATPRPTPTEPPYPTLLAVGDIADCESIEDDFVADIAASNGGLIATLGDTVYESGAPDEFAECFDPAWGPLKSRIRPAVGNHEYLTPGARGYFGYFGEAAGDPSQGYYSYRYGSWFIVVLNSQCSEAGGCDAGSPQALWLEAELAANPTLCSLAYFHIPRFSSGDIGSSDRMQDMWQIMQRHGVEVALAGHDHLYERFAPQDAFGNLDPERGIRQFVVGTGGKNHRPFATVLPNSEVQDARSHGLLRLTLKEDSYEWEFLPIYGDQLQDTGSDSCHE